MTSPRVEVDLGKIQHNTRTLSERLEGRGIKVTGVTKAVCGNPAIAQAMLDGGAVGLADARIANVQRMRHAGITCPMTLIRTPLLSQIEDIIRACDTSYNTEIDVIAELAAAAVRKGVTHKIILMVEMGDMREGILSENVASIAERVIKMEGVALKGLGANFACFGGIAPDVDEMSALSMLADDIEGQCGPFIEILSGGNSASLPWALQARTSGRINDLRIGEAILLGVDPVTGEQIGGLYTDAFSLVAEVIETGEKSAAMAAAKNAPWTPKIRLVADNENCTRSILAIGHQDTDTLGLSMPSEITFLGATSDHLVVQTGPSETNVGSEMSFTMNYSALMRAMAAPDITVKLLAQPTLSNPHGDIGRKTALALV